MAEITSQADCGHHRCYGSCGYRQPVEPQASEIERLRGGQAAAQVGPDGWRQFPQELPPSIGSGGFSPCLWIAFEDGGVELGRCLHKFPSSTHDQPVHAWFTDGAQVAASRAVVAWRPLVAPTHPGATP